MPPVAEGGPPFTAGEPTGLVPGSGGEGRSPELIYDEARNPEKAPLVLFFLLDPAFLDRLGDDLLLDVAGGFFIMREFHQE